MKSIKVGFMIGLLMASSNIFCELDRSMNQATTDLYFATIAAVRSAIVIGCSSYVIDAILYRFESTQNMENRGAVASGACVALYALFLLSAEYHKNDSDVTAGQKRSYLPSDDEKIKSLDVQLLDTANLWFKSLSRIVCRLTGIKEDAAGSMTK